MKVQLDNTDILYYGCKQETVAGMENSDSLF